MGAQESDMTERHTLWLFTVAGVQQMSAANSINTLLYRRELHIPYFFPY